jgi:hypothetical protein
MAVAIAFEGWFQARFATDEDAFDDPRGRVGWTFAYEGEPDFDRIIRLANPVAPRVLGPQVGVSVTEVRVNGAAVANHVLLGAPVQWLDGPKFEGHNGDISPDGQEPVFPFNLVIAAGNVSLRVTEWLHFEDLTSPSALPRFGRGNGDADDATLQRVLGTTNFAQFRARRKQNLTAELQQTNDATLRKNLQQRLARMDNPGIEVGSLGFRVPYAFRVPDASRAADDPTGTLGPGLLAQPWRMNWWMGCWDADALCGYMLGSLNIG